MESWNWSLILQVATAIATWALLISLIQGGKTLKMAMIIGTRDKFVSIYDTLIDHPDLVRMYRGGGVPETGQTVDTEYAFALKYFEALTAYALLERELNHEFKSAFPDKLSNLLGSDRLVRLWEELKDEYPHVTDELVKRSQ
jgi:hypothetical protein